MDQNFKIEDSDFCSYQGFYSSVKIKFQEYSTSFPRVPFRKELIYMEFIKSDKNVIAFDYCKQYMPKSKHNLRLNVQGFYSPDK